MTQGENSSVKKVIDYNVINGSYGNACAGLGVAIVSKHYKGASERPFEEEVLEIVNLDRVRHADRPRVINEILERHSRKLNLKVASNTLTPD